MGMIIAVLNQKGGCGKTTTTDTVSDMLARSGYSVLDIELDPQGNLGLLHGCKDDRNCLYIHCSRVAHFSRSGSGRIII